MKSKKNLIIKAGFGELTSEEQRRLEALSPEETAEVERMKKVRDGLKALREVPECQMSSQRLRDAILNEGVVQSKQSRPWTFAVVAAAAILVVYFGAQLDVLGERDLVGVVGPDSGSVDFDNVFPKLELGIQDSVASTEGVGNEDSILMSDPTEVDIVAMSGSRLDEITTSRNGSREDDIVILVPPWQYGSEGGMSIVRFDPQPDSVVFPTFTAESGEEDDEYANHLIVVDYVEDPNTGAFVATEVETFGDVVFGG